MKRYAEKRISDFLEDLSSHASVPGGGSAAAFSGALGASLLSMVAHFSGAKGSSRRRKEIKELLLETYRIRDELVKLVDEDAESYKEVTRAQRSAKLLAHQKSRVKILREAHRKATASSFSICQASHRGLRIGRRLLRIGNERLESDTRGAIFFLSAGFKAAYLMTEENLRWMKDPPAAKKTKRMLSSIRSEVSRILKAADK